MQFHRLIRTVLRMSLFLVCIATLSDFSYAQNVWKKTVGIKAPSDSRLVSQNGITLLYSPTQVFMSNNGGYIWWSISEQFPNGLVAACGLPGKVVGLSVGTDRTVTMHSTTNSGATWLWKAAFTLDVGQELVEVVARGNTMAAYTKQGLIYSSVDGGGSWRRIKVWDGVGELVDLASIGNTWVVCGTQGTARSNDDGVTWVPSTIPFKIGGYLSAIEIHGNEIWGGGPFGMARFDVSSTSWLPSSRGLETSAGMMPTVIDLRELDGVLFGLFRQPDNKNTCYRWDGSQWIPVDNGGLPYGTQVSRFRFSIWRNLLQVFVSGYDANLNGVYVVSHQSPTGVDEVTPTNTALFPIPTESTLHIAGIADTDAVVSVVDPQGAVVLEGTMNDGTIDVRSLAAGTYLLRLTIGDNTSTHVFIVRR